jgi:hypothetical protein
LTKQPDITPVKITEEKPMFRRNRGKGKGNFRHRRNGKSFEHKNRKFSSKKDHKFKEKKVRGKFVPYFKD